MEIFHTCRILIPVFVALLLCGCPDQKKNGDKTIIPASKLYPKITDHGMTLNIISTRGNYYISETAPTMRFQFRNDGLNHVEIPEWKTRERENIRIQYAECPEIGGSVNIPEDFWKESPRTVFPGDCPRFKLELEPKNSIIMELPLKFIGTLKKPGRYAVRGIMDLTSLDVKSVPVELIIR